MDKKFTPERFQELLPGLCAAETAWDPKTWTPDNPTSGHCAIAALVAQDLFGGDLMCTTMYGIDECHWWNRFPDGSQVDFTDAQFPGGYPEPLRPETRTRAYALSYPDTLRRYELLRARVAAKLKELGLS